MDNIKQYKYVIIIISIILVYSFYWYELRPSSIKKECSKKLPQFEKLYKKCLAEHGL